MSANNRLSRERGSRFRACEACAAARHPFGGAASCAHSARGLREHGMSLANRLFGGETASEADDDSDQKFPAAALKRIETLLIEGQRKETQRAQNSEQERRVMDQKLTRIVDELSTITDQLASLQTAVKRRPSVSAIPQLTDAPSFQSRQTGRRSFLSGMHILPSSLEPGARHEPSLTSTADRRTADRRTTADGAPKRNVTEHRNMEDMYVASP